MPLIKDYGEALKKLVFWLIIIVLAGSLFMCVAGRIIFM